MTVTMHWDSDKNVEQLLTTWERVNKEFPIAKSAMDHRSSQRRLASHFSPHESARRRLDDAVDVEQRRRNSEAAAAPT